MVVKGCHVDRLCLQDVCYSQRVSCSQIVPTGCMLPSKGVMWTGSCLQYICYSQMVSCGQIMPAGCMLQSMGVMQSDHACRMYITVKGCHVDRIMPTGCMLQSKDVMWTGSCLQDVCYSQRVVYGQGLNHKLLSTGNKVGMTAFILAVTLVFI